MAAPGSGPTLLDMVTKKEHLLRARRLDDIFAGMKAGENSVALPIYQEVAACLDSLAGDPEAALIAVVEAVLAGNLFDAGAAAALQNMAFCDDVACAVVEDKFALDASQLHATFLKAQAKVARPQGGWRFDDLDRVVSRARAKPWKAALIFCDNAGADTMGATLLARHLATLRGADAKVALVANSTAALNDITYSELEEFVASAADGDPVIASHLREGRISCVPSGQGTTLLDMNSCSSELCDWVNAVDAKPQEWLVVLEGMGRSIESNWDAGSHFKPGVDVMSVAMVKSEINARRLGASVYDCVVRLNTGK